MSFVKFGQILYKRGGTRDFDNPIFKNRGVGALNVLPAQDVQASPNADPFTFTAPWNAIVANGPNVLDVFILLEEGGGAAIPAVSAISDNQGITYNNITNLGVVLNVGVNRGFNLQAWFTIRTAAQAAAYTTSVTVTGTGAGGQLSFERCIFDQALTTAKLDTGVIASTFAGAPANTVYTESTTTKDSNDLMIYTDWQQDSKTSQADPAYVNYFQNNVQATIFAGIMYQSIPGTNPSVSPKINSGSGAGSGTVIFLYIPMTRY